MKLLLILSCLIVNFCRGAKVTSSILKSPGVIESSVSKYEGKDRRSQTNLDVENSNKNIPERNMKDINNNSDDLVTIDARAQAKMPDVEATNVKSIFTKLDKDNKRCNICDNSVRRKVLSFFCS